MSSYSIIIKQGDHVLHSIENVVLPDPTEAWSFIKELSNQFPSPGLRVVVKDEEGNVVIMAGLMGAERREHKSPPKHLPRWVRLSGLPLDKI